MQYRSEIADGDPEAVRYLVSSTGYFTAEEVDVAVELLEETLGKGEASGYEFVFLDGNDGLLGYVCYGRIPATQSSFDLYWIAVTPDRQREGLGGRLIREAEAQARRKGAERMYVDTAGKDQYRPTRAFYERHGYRRAAVLEDFYAPGDAKIIYEKQLG